MKFERPPKLWIAWVAIVVGLIVAGLLFAGCGTTSAYRGPVGKEVVVQLDQKRYFVQEDPRWPPVVKAISTLNVTNPSMDDMTVTVDCEGRPMAPGTYMKFDISARTTQSLLLLPEDVSCIVKQEQ